MIYLLVKSHLRWLEDHNLGFLRVFTFVTFQATVAVMLSFLIVILAGPSVIAWLRKQKIGDLAKFDQADIDKVMAGKKGTPTMGGVLINVSILFTAAMLADLKNFYVLMALLCVIWLGTVGAVDDWLKLTAARRGGGRQGLSSLEKLIFQVALGLLLSIFTYSHGRLLPEATGFHVPFWKNPVFQLSAPLYVPDRHVHHHRHEQCREPHRRPRRAFLRLRRDRRHRVSRAVADHRRLEACVGAAVSPPRRRRPDGRARRARSSAPASASSGSTATPPASSWATQVHWRWAG
jgi:hypothetical protein